MIKKLTDEATRQRILGLVKKDIARCLYLGIDLEVYGLDCPDVTFYYSETGGTIDLVVMHYYDSVRMFTPSGNWDVQECAEFIRPFRPMAVCGEKSMIERIQQFFRDYDAEYGIVIADTEYKKFPQFRLVSQAVEQDIPEITQLMCSTEEFSRNNTPEVLERQLRDRMRMGMGRDFIIRENGVIAAHTAIYAECGEAAVESGLVVHEDYKKKFYGLIIHEYIKKTLSEENKTLYGLRYNDGMQKNARAEKLDVRAECGKLVPKKE